jgi:hypothetical protein
MSGMWRINFSLNYVSSKHSFKCLTMFKGSWTQ